jgi:hypothetical protein
MILEPSEIKQLISRRRQLDPYTELEYKVNPQLVGHCLKYRCMDAFYLWMFARAYCQEQYGEQVATINDSVRFVKDIAVRMHRSERHIRRILAKNTCIGDTRLFSKDVNINGKHLIKIASRERLVDAICRFESNKAQLNYRKIKTHRDPKDPDLRTVEIVQADVTIINSYVSNELVSSIIDVAPEGKSNIRGFFNKDNLLVASVTIPDIWDPDGRQHSHSKAMDLVREENTLHGYSRTALAARVGMLRNSTIRIDREQNVDHGQAWHAIPCTSIFTKYDELRNDLQNARTLKKPVLVRHLSDSIKVLESRFAEMTQTLVHYLVSSTVHASCEIPLYKYGYIQQEDGSMLPAVLVAGTVRHSTPLAMKVVEDKYLKHSFPDGPVKVDKRKSSGQFDFNLLKAMPVSPGDEDTTSKEAKSNVVSKMVQWEFARMLTAYNKPLVRLLQTSVFKLPKKWLKRLTSVEEMHERTLFMHNLWKRSVSFVDAWTSEIHKKPVSKERKTRAFVSSFFSENSFSAS